MADELENWPIEEIPDADSVFMRAHRVFFSSGGELKPGVFRCRDNSNTVSVNWDRYATAEDTQQQARKDPDDNGIIRMPVVGIRRINNLTVKHTPLVQNRSHADVGPFSDHREEITETRVLLLRIAEVVKLPVNS